MTVEVLLAVPHVKAHHAAVVVSTPNIKRAFSAWVLGGGFKRHTPEVELELPRGPAGSPAERGGPTPDLAGAPRRDEHHPAIACLWRASAKSRVIHDEFLVPAWASGSTPLCETDPLQLPHEDPRAKTQPVGAPIVLHPAPQQQPGLAPRDHRRLMGAMRFRILAQQTETSPDVVAGNRPTSHVRRQYASNTNEILHGTLLR